MILTLALVAGSLAACQSAEETASEAADEASEAADEASELFGDGDYLTADIEDTEADGTVSGTARFAYDDENDEVYVEGQVEGLSPGEHGFHVHENGSCEMQDGTPAGAAGGHYNPDDTPHGAPDDPQEERHVGDFGNIQANDEGVAEFSFSYDRDATDLDSFEGLGLVVHGGRDDLTSQPSGAAGPRVGCAVIQTAEDAGM